MVRKVNKGFSIVEVIIAVAIFLVLMVPIVTSLISSMKTTTAGKELQYRNEYAQNLMESVKEVSVDVLNDSTKAETYFKGLGSEGVSVTPITNGYQISGKTYLGVERAEYSYLIEMDGSAYTTINELKSGVVQNLDKTKVALISANFANYDTPAYNALLTKKMSEWRKKRSETPPQQADYSSEEVYKAELKKWQYGPFESDTGKRVIEIAVKGSVSAGYDVTCRLQYFDDCSETAKSGNSIGKEVGKVEYTPYVQHFKTLSDIYLMYNVCVYNNRYAKDYITFDLSGLDESTKINVFVIETASGHSQGLKDADTGGSLLKGGKDKDGNPVDLYRRAGTTVRDSEEINMALKNVGLTDKKKNNFHVYHNMLKSSETDEEWNKHSKNTTVKYDSSVATEVYNITSKEYVELLSSNVAGLGNAQDANRGLYAIKVWMQKGDLDATTLKAGDSVLQGTRGGSEID